MVNNVNAVIGNNFSGRSDFLKSLCFVEEKEEGAGKSLYIGAQHVNSISGISPTVQAEIDLHSTNINDDYFYEVNNLLHLFEFEKNYFKNPFVLSGGEQAMLVILTGLLLRPRLFALDTVVEQLDAEWRSILFDAISSDKFSHTKIFLADNRLDEYKLTGINTTIPQLSIIQDVRFDFQQPRRDVDIVSTSHPQNIELNDLSFRYYRNTDVLKNINIKLEPYNIYHLRGKNGAGKSTLAKILTGIIKPKTGNIIVNDNPFNAYKYPGSLLGYSFQNPDEQLFSSNIENEVLRVLKHEPIEHTIRRERLLRMFGLQYIRKYHPADMPFVIRKRIALASTLAIDRPWYILDEPTLGQDNSFVEFLLKILENLKKQGKGVIIISHSNFLDNKLLYNKLYLAKGELKLG